MLRYILRNGATCQLFFARHSYTMNLRRNVSSKLNTFDNQRKLEAQRLFQIFASDGIVDKPGFSAILTALGTVDQTEHLAEFDHEGGEMDFATFMKHCDEYTRDIKQNLIEVQQAFRVFDRDGNGKISAEELSSILNTCSSPMEIEDAKSLISAVDKDGDGEINYDEFRALLEDGLVGWRFRTGYRVVYLLGGPGSGKGTLYKEIAKRLHCAHVSTGDLLRGEVSQGTPLGKKVAQVMESGGLVDPDIIMRLLRTTLQKHSGKYVFVDGFPRSVQNSEDFYAICGKPEFALWLHTSDEILTQRLLNRGLTSGRADDNLKTIQERLKTYHQSTDSLKAHFLETNMPVYTLDATGAVDVLAKELFEMPYFRHHQEVLKSSHTCDNDDKEI